MVEKVFFLPRKDLCSYLWCLTAKQGEKDQRKKWCGHSSFDMHVSMTIDGDKHANLLEQEGDIVRFGLILEEVRERRKSCTYVV